MKFGAKEKRWLTMHKKDLPSVDEGQDFYWLDGKSYRVYHMPDISEASIPIWENITTIADLKRKMRRILRENSKN